MRANTVSYNSGAPNFSGTHYTLSTTSYIIIDYVEKRFFVAIGIMCYSLTSHDLWMAHNRPEVFKTNCYFWKRAYTLRDILQIDVPSGRPILVAAILVERTYCSRHFLSSLKIQITATSSDTTKFLGKKVKAKFVHYIVSFISKIGLLVFELSIKTYPSKK